MEAIVTRPSCHWMNIMIISEATTKTAPRITMLTLVERESWITIMSELRRETINSGFRCEIELLT